jgi:hypothetical protein
VEDELGGTVDEGSAEEVLSQFEVALESARHFTKKVSKIKRLQSNLPANTNRCYTGMNFRFDNT